jgi:hypothetical protein
VTDAVGHVAGSQSHLQWLTWYCLARINAMPRAWIQTTLKLKLPAARVGDRAGWRNEECAVTLAPISGDGARIKTVAIGPRTH